MNVIRIYYKYVCILGLKIRSVFTYNLVLENTQMGTIFNY